MAIRPGDVPKADAIRNAKLGRLHAEIDGYCYVWASFTFDDPKPGDVMRIIPGPMWSAGGDTSHLHWLCKEHGLGAERG